jgi:hypothetical protein
LKFPLRNSFAQQFSEVVLLVLLEPFKPTRIAGAK